MPRTRGDVRLGGGGGGKKLNKVLASTQSLTHKKPSIKSSGSSSSHSGEKRDLPNWQQNITQFCKSKPKLLIDEQENIEPASKKPCAPLCDKPEDDQTTHGREDKKEGLDNDSVVAVTVQETVILDEDDESNPASFTPVEPSQKKIQIIESDDDDA